MSAERAKRGSPLRPRFIRNFEAEAYAGGSPFLQPLAVRDGLAIYSVGQGEPILLLPYPHADMTMPMAQDSLSRLLVGLGRRVLSFDAPGAFASTRPARGDMAEMLRCALETLSGCGVQGKVDVIGHSMGSLCALGLAVEHPEAVRRLVLVGGMAGFPAVIRWGMPGSVWKWNEPEFWQCMSWGLRLRYGRGSLALHKRLSNLMARPCFFNKSLFAPLPLHPEDHARGVPIRYLWLRNLGWKLDYASRLGQVGCPTLICAGRHDPETPLPCSEQLRRGIPGSRLTLFEHSGHAPFLEEPELFARSVARFLSE